MKVLHTGQAKHEWKNVGREIGLTLLYKHFNSTKQHSWLWYNKKITFWSAFRHFNHKITQWRTSWIKSEGRCFYWLDMPKKVPLVRRNAFPNKKWSKDIHSHISYAYIPFLTAWLISRISSLVLTASPIRFSSHTNTSTWNPNKLCLTNLKWLFE